MSWNRAMDEVRVERLIQNYKDSDGLVSEDPALVMLKKWPTSKQYQDNSDRLPGLEQLVCINNNNLFIYLFIYLLNTYLLLIYLFIYVCINSN